VSDSNDEVRAGQTICRVAHVPAGRKNIDEILDDCFRSLEALVDRQRKVSI